MRIAAVTPDFPPWASGGAPQAVRALAGIWASEGHEVTVIASRPRSLRDREPQDAPFRTVAIDLWDLPQRLHEAAYFAPMIAAGHRTFRDFARSAQRDYDAVVLVGLLETVPREFLRHSVARSDNVASVQFGVSSARGHRVLHGFSELAYRIYGRRLGRRLARVVLFSDEGEEEWQRYVRPPSSVHLERAVLGVDGATIASDLDRLREHPEDTRAWYAEHQIRPPYLFAVGRNDRAKGFDTAIEAFGLIASEHPDLSFVLAGERTPFTTELERAAIALGLTGRVRFLGRVSDGERDALLSGARLFLIPSRKEGYGLNAVLARVLGKPTVATISGAHPEILDDAARFVLVPPDDPESLAAGIREALTRATVPMVLDAAQLRRFDNHPLARQLLPGGTPALGAAER